jgi:hypothetical protein
MLLDLGAGRVVHQVEFHKRRAAKAVDEHQRVAADPSAKIACNGRERYGNLKLAPGSLVGATLGRGDLHASRRGGRESEKGISVGAWSVSTGAGCIDRRVSGREISTNRSAGTFDPRRTMASASPSTGAPHRLGRASH